MIQTQAFHGTVLLGCMHLKNLKAFSVLLLFPAGFLICWISQMKILFYSSELLGFLIMLNLNCYCELFHCVAVLTLGVWISISIITFWYSTKSKHWSHAQLFRQSMFNLIMQGLASFSHLSLFEVKAKKAIKVVFFLCPKVLLETQSGSGLFLDESLLKVQARELIKIVILFLCPKKFTAHCALLLLTWLGWFTVTRRSKYLPRSMMIVYVFNMPMKVIHWLKIFKTSIWVNAPST